MITPLLANEKFATSVYNIEQKTSTKEKYRSSSFHLIGNTLRMGAQSREDKTTLCPLVLHETTIRRSFEC